jgi:hypothetical protein
MSDDDRERAARAEARRRTMVIVRTRLGDEDADAAPVSGESAAEAVEQMTRTAWAFSGKAIPEYPRHAIPVRFVRGRLT